MQSIRRVGAIVVLTVCGALCAGCAGVIGPDIDPNPGMTAAVEQARLATEAALADAQRAADAAQMATVMAAIQIAAQANPPVAPPPAP